MTLEYRQRIDLLCPAKTKEKAIHIPNTVTTIDELAFRMCRDTDFDLPLSEERRKN